MEKAILTFIFLGLFISSQIYSQNKSEHSRIGKIAFNNERYQAAISHFEEVIQSEPRNFPIQFQLGISYYQIGQYEAAEKILNPCLSQSKIPEEDLFFYLAKVHHSNHQFNKAVKSYKDFLKKAEKLDSRRIAVKSEILRCASGLGLMQNKNKIIVENLGDNVNSAFQDRTPIQSPTNPNKLYFSSQKRGLTEEHFGRFIKRRTQMFCTDSEGGKWGDNLLVSDLSSVNENEILLDFSSLGERLFFLSTSEAHSGKILFKHFQNRQIQDTREPKPYATEPILFESPLSPEKGDRSMHFFDGKNLIFSSRRPGGLGGLDLYWTRLENGRWTIPENLGKPINTEFDETSPFLAKDGRTLYFSSNHHRRSMGGLDVLKSVFSDESKEWSEPENLEFPINSPEDDIDFRLTRDGRFAYFSSNRKSGYGQHDIYSAIFVDVQPEQLMTYDPSFFADVLLPEKIRTEIPPKEQPADEKIFKVQIVFKENKESELRDKFPQLIAEKSTNPTEFRYTIRTYRTIQSANSLKKDLLRQGYANVEVIEADKK